jgi:hypothetical protein
MTNPGHAGLDPASMTSGLRVKLSELVEVARNDIENGLQRKPAMTNTKGFVIPGLTRDPGAAWSHFQGRGTDCSASPQ